MLLVGVVVAVAVIGLAGAPLAAPDGHCPAPGLHECAGPLPRPAASPGAAPSGFIQIPDLEPSVPLVVTDILKIPVARG